MRIVTSALYVDFDNIFLTIRGKYYESVARKFALNIDEWMKYIISFGTQDLYGSSFRRRFQKKTMYFNPTSFKDYRLSFLRAGFKVVDCPPLLRGKTCADMNIAVDMITDLYNHNYDEYVLFSGDVDFSPVLLHINENCKTTLQLGVGGQASHYRNSASVSLSEDEFIKSFNGEIVQVGNYSVQKNGVTATGVILNSNNSNSSTIDVISEIKEVKFPILEQDEYKCIITEIGSCLIRGISKKSIARSTHLKVRKMYENIPLDIVKFFVYTINIDNELMDNIISKEEHTKNIALASIPERILTNFFQSKEWKSRKNTMLEEQHIVNLLRFGKSKFSRLI